MVRYVLILVVCFFVSCKKEEKATPKVRYEKTKEEKQEPKTTQIQVADLPIQFEGTSVLIHPIGDLNIADDNSYKKQLQSYTIATYNDYQLTGYLQNLKFQEVNSDSLKVLTDKPILIETVTYLKNIADRTKKQFLIYTISDNDTNQDGNLNEDDVKTLYASDVSGNGFIKLSPDMQEVIDWNSIQNSTRIYFRTIEDINKNGAFDTTDTIHYYYVDVLKDWKAVEYKPI